MAYATDKKPGELTALTTLAVDDVFVVGDTSDASEVAKGITKANLITDLGSSFAAVLGADDNYVTDAEKVKLSNLSGTNTGDQTNITGNAATVTTNANLTGHVTSVGNAAVLGSFTKAQLDGAVSDGNVMYVGDAPTAHTHLLAAGATDVTATATELNYVGGVTSAIQTQITAKPTISSGAGAPASTPTKVGDIYIDTTGDDAYLAVGTATSADWEKTNDGAGVADGDKGDITVSASGATWTIDNGVVTLAKQADMATASVVYRKTAGSGAPEVQTLATLKTDLGLTGTNSGDQTSIVGITGTKAQFDTAVTDGNFMYTGDAPTSHTHLLSEITDSTTEALGVGSLEVGHASDTTITRVSAGLIAVEGSNLIRASDVDDTPVNGETAAPISSNWAFDHAALASSDTVVGHVEIATTAETNTGTDATRAVSADGLAGSYAGTKSVSIQVYDGATDVATGDGKAYITIPEALNGMNLIRAQATVVTAGTTNATTVMIHNKTDAADMLSGAISIASAGTVGTVGTVNGATDDVATNDVLRIDVDSVSTTAPKGLQVILEFRLP